MEGNVGHIGERIALMLRNRRFFSLDEVEDAVAEKLEDLNARPFRKRADGSRKEVFLSKERAMLFSLPDVDFEPGRWCERTVGPDYRVSVDGTTYSVPYLYIGKKAEVRVGREAVEVFCEGERIATHPRAHARGADVSQKSHQPKWHTEFLERSGERYRQRAREEIGPWGYKVIDSMLRSKKVEEQSYRACSSLLALAKSRGGDAVEDACRRACDLARCPSLKTVKILLKNQTGEREQRDVKKDYAILREKDYYGPTGPTTDDDAHEGGMR